MEVPVPAPTRSARRLAASLGAAILLAACSSGGDAAAPDEGPATDGALVVVGTDTLKFEPTSLEADAGEVTVELRCEPAVAHNFVIEETDAKIAECNAGGTDTGSAELEAGEYTYYCDLPGHRTAGMEGTLTVS